MMSRWKFTCRAQHPKQKLGATWNVGVPEGKIKLLQSHGHEVRLARLMLAVEVLQDPTAIYRGWARPGMDDCYIYVGRPGRDLRSMSIETPAPPGLQFLVFVMPDGTIDDWTWRASVATDPGTPEGVSGERIWPQ